MAKKIKGTFALVPLILKQSLVKTKGKYGISLTHGKSVQNVFLQIFYSVPRTDAVTFANNLKLMLPFSWRILFANFPECC